MASVFPLASSSRTLALTLSLPNPPDLRLRYLQLKDDWSELRACEDAPWPFQAPARLATNFWVIHTGLRRHLRPGGAKVQHSQDCQVVG